MAVRACVQCGLSVSETATFCAVCGARFDTAPDRWDNAEWHEETSPLVADLGLEPAAQDASSLEADTGGGSHSTIAPAEPEASQPDEDPLVSNLAEVSSLLGQAAGSEEMDAGHAAALYREAILVCLDATEEPLGSEDVQALLVCGFDGLSSLLERGGLAEEALAVVEDAASLGLLSDDAEAGAESREVLKDRRENLRRTLFADSAQL